MRIGILGTGTVGQTLADKLLSLGHEITLGSRSPSNPAGLAWAQAVGPHGHSGTFAEAAGFGELVVNATPGTVSLDVLAAAGAQALAGKIVVDVCNPLVFAADGTVTLDPVNSDSMGERIQRACPDSRVVKALNTLAAPVMVNPGRVPGRHNLFVAGDDAGAKQEVTALLESFGWPAADIVDLGGIQAARGMEMLMPFWLNLMRHYGHTDFNYRLQVAD
ncbi:NAD(P)-binding domain-containing protein [Kitasatospora sp. NBC_01250]|uniref:NADPH-dependent F420 reductase n=1 Tax=unclassified Kitasatospora TaxID=2633591 RepID=UPI002E0FA630|nr:MULTISPECIES: NAD(P)-binding domain-containing protein [unclassified Kitasatospora]WSJ69891.1 NAD(P)-binding domain-containing protein [Kitasatospora sp. NBC_01302]